MDVRIAREVMNWDPIDIFEHEEMGELGYVPISAQPKASVPRYSESVAAAWEVVEELRKHFPEVVISSRSAYDINQPGAPKVDTWDVLIPDAKVHTFVRGDLLPACICLAALRAKGVL